MIDDSVDDPIASLLEHRALSPAEQPWPKSILLVSTLPSTPRAGLPSSRLIIRRWFLPAGAGRLANSPVSWPATLSLTENGLSRPIPPAPTGTNYKNGSMTDDHPKATTKAAIAVGLNGVMAGRTDAQRVKLSRHFADLAFDVQPTSNAALKDAIKALPNLLKFLANEGGLTIWHAKFKSA